MKDKQLDSSFPLYTLRVAAQLSNTSIYSIRQYIDKGLLIPYRTSTNRHLFSKVDIQRLKCIRRYLDDMGLNIAGIKALFAVVPCWKLKNCSLEDRYDCDAYVSITLPCWEVPNKGGACKDLDCRTCEVYKLPEECTDLKSFLKLHDQ